MEDKTVRELVQDFLAFKTDIKFDTKRVSKSGNPFWTSENKDKIIDIIGELGLPESVFYALNESWKKNGYLTKGEWIHLIESIDKALEEQVADAAVDLQEEESPNLNPTSNFESISYHLLESEHSMSSFWKERVLGIRKYKSGSSVAVIFDLAIPEKSDEDSE